MALIDSTWPGLPKLALTCSNLPKLALTFPNLPKLALTFPNLPKITQTFPKSPKLGLAQLGSVWLWGFPQANALEPVENLP